MLFLDTKTVTLNLLVSPAFKHVLKGVADYEQRSMVNILDVLLADYCDRRGIILAEREAATTSPWSHVREKHSSHKREPK